MNRIVGGVWGALMGLILLPALLHGNEINAGEDVFRRKCAACHFVSVKRKVGPGLADISRRVTREWSREWISDPQGAWERNEGYTRVLRKSVRDGEARTKTLMQFKVVGGFPTPEEIEAVLEYMDTL